MHTYSISPAVESLKDLKKFYNLTEIEKKVTQGKKAIWSGLSWETPLIYACDMIPIGSGELWKKDSHTAEGVGENHYQIPPEFCSMVKTMMGRIHLRAPDPINKILYFGAACEPIVVVYEMAKKENYDVFCIDNVTALKSDEKRPEVLRFLVKELERAALWLNDSKPLDEEKLWKEIKFKNLVMEKIRKILDLRLKAPLYLSSKDTMNILAGSNHYFGQPDRFVELLNQVIEELAVAVQTPEYRFYIPIVLAGGGYGNEEVIEAIEESGGVIMGWITFGTVDYRLDVSPLESIAHYVLDSQTRGELGEGAGTSATYRAHSLERLVNKTGSRGVISSAITGCPYGSIVQKNERDYFKNLGIPIITLETSVHKERPTEEQIMRIKTFVEMLSARKDG